jgi:hypothetical protein
MNTQDRRPRDWAYGAEFHHEDIPALKKMARIFRSTEDTRLIEEYYNACEKRLNDHKPVITVGNKNVEFIQAVKSDDLAVTLGLQQYINITLGLSSARWTHIAYGFGGTTANPNIADFKLNSEYSARITCSTLGWARVAGLKIMFGGIVGESIAASPINEMGVFNASSGGIMLNHNNFNQIPLTRTIGMSAFILSSVYQLAPKA